ncbi:hypothetical protein [Fodinicola feengrottensis]|uniref:hypothetical protein n=1 Tax=Fodinicola feengrottensis TaxID=435914 RepID=UPI0024423083|nr:hypothetical protein [Fodinicola feengrottensis]
MTMTHSGFASPLSTAADFRGLGTQVIRDALKDAKTRVFEPYHHFDLEVPADAMAAVLPKIAEAGGIVRETVVRAGIGHLNGLLPGRQPARHRTTAARTDPGRGRTPRRVHRVCAG